MCLLLLLEMNEKVETEEGTAGSIKHKKSLH